MLPIESANSRTDKMAKKTIRGGYLECSIKTYKYSCELEPTYFSRGRNKGGKFTTERLQVEALSPKTLTTIDSKKPHRVRLIPGEDKVISCEIKKDSAWCKVLK